MLRAQTTTTRTKGISIGSGSLYPMLVPGTRCYKWTKPGALQFKWKNGHRRAIPWRQNTHYFFVFPIESAQHVMLFLWTGSQQDRVFCLEVAIGLPAVTRLE